MQLSPRTQATLLIACVVLLAGCTTILGDSTEDEFLDELANTEPPEQLSATQENIFGTGDEEIALEQDVWMRTTGESRFASTNGSEWLTVTDGERTWEYYPEDNRAVERDVSSTDDSVIDELYDLSVELVTDLTIETIEQTTFDGNAAYAVTLDASLNETDAVEDSILDVIRQPLSPGIESDAAVAVEPTDENVTEDYADIEAVELSFEKETMFPVKSIIETDESRSETVYRNVTFDPIPDEKFEFDPPSDAVVEEPESPDRTEFETVSEASEYADLPLTEPTAVPDGFERDGIAVVEWTERNETRLSLSYVGSESEFLSLTITDHDIDVIGDGEEESVAIGQHQGTYQVNETVGLHLLEWACDPYELAITAPETVDRDALIEMAESTGCK